jgi:pyruvate formate lyase activating enzyme
VKDTAALAKEEGLKNVLVTNGYIKEEPLKELLPFIDALNIDVKSISGIFYQNLCNSSLEPVLKCAEIAIKHAHVEITNLLIPTLNDTSSQIKQLVHWVKDALGSHTPLHFSRYFPHHQLHIPPTPLSTLKKAYEIAKEELDYVYLGNIMDESTGSTYCAGCGQMVIGRRGYHIFLYQINKEGRCKKCGTRIWGCF